MTSKPIVSTQQCTQLLTTRYWGTLRCPMSGWLLIKNLHPGATIRMHWDESGNDNSGVPILPMHSKPFQVDEGDDVWVSSPVSMSQVRFEIAKYKPVLDDWGFEADQAVGNVAFSASAVAVTTTYTPSTLTKGYCTYFQVVADTTGFVGTVEWSADNGTTYSTPIIMNDGDPLKRVFEESSVCTTIRVTRTGGTFTIYYR